VTDETRFARVDGHWAYCETQVFVIRDLEADDQIYEWASADTSIN